MTIEELVSREITIDVTQDDIDNGEKAACHFCPIALALNRMTGMSSIIGSTKIHIGEIGQGGATCYTSPEMREFVWKFDTDRGVKPTSFVATFRRYPE